MNLWRTYFRQVLIAVDQLANALIPPVTGRIGWADETLSSRSYRAHRAGLMWGAITMPVIDLLFSWDCKGHCKKSYLNAVEARRTAPENRKE